MKISSIGTSGVGPFIDASYNRLRFASRSPRNIGTCTSVMSPTISTCPSNGSGNRLSRSFAFFSITSVVRSSGNARLTPGVEASSFAFPRYACSATSRTFSRNGSASPATSTPERVRSPEVCRFSRTSRYGAISEGLRPGSESREWYTAARKMVNKPAHTSQR